MENNISSILSRIQQIQRRINQIKQVGEGKKLGTALPGGEIQNSTGTGKNDQAFAELLQQALLQNLNSGGTEQDLLGLGSTQNSQANGNLQPDALNLIRLLSGNSGNESAVNQLKQYLSENDLSSEALLRLLGSSMGEKADDSADQ